MINTMSGAYLYNCVRTPFGKYGGKLSATRPDDLAAHVITTTLSKVPSLDPAHIDDVIFGNTNGAGEENRNVARMASLLAGLPHSVPGVTVNRLCGSSLDAVIQGSRAILAGDAHIVLTGGVESMSRAPYVLPKSAKPFPAGDATLHSTTLGWRLVNPRMDPTWTISLGAATEKLRARHQISREDQDIFALGSHTAAAKAWADGFYDELVEPIPGVDLTRDECIREHSTLDKLGSLTPAFDPSGTVTAGNASPLNDGASAVLLGSESAADRLGTDPIARIVSRAATALAPQDFGYAPVDAANDALRRAGITWADVDAVELNEAFAAQSLACLRAWDIDPELVNACGGAIAIGHPLGASGGRIVGTLAARLRRTGGRYGVAAICIGVGQGLAIVLENVS